MGISVHEGPVEAEAINIIPHCPVHSTGEQVASSQGSPFFRPAVHVRKLMQLVGEGEDFSKSKAYLNGKSSGSALTTAVTPATFKVRNV